LTKVSEEEELDEFVEVLVLLGAVELTSFGEDGEPIYRVTERCKEVLPELYEEHSRIVQEIVHSLWLLDVVEVSFDEDGYQVASVQTYNYLRYLEVADTLTDEQVRLVETLVGLQSSRVD